MGLRIYTDIFFELIYCRKSFFIKSIRNNNNNILKITEVNMLKENKLKVSILLAFLSMIRLNLIQNLESEIKSQHRRQLRADEDGNTFDMVADITVEFDDDNTLHYLEAFKFSSNNRILMADNSDHNRMRWFSIGLPSLLVHKDKETQPNDCSQFGLDRLFHPNRNANKRTTSQFCR